MKNFVSAALAVVAMTLAYSCSSGHYVSAQPNAVVVARPASPGPNYIWVDGDYYYRGGRYNYRNGYWARPRTGRVYRSGSWSQSQRGYQWRRGGWR